MQLTATDAKNRFGQVLEQAQKRPVFIEKSGRRHSVVLSVEQYERLLGAAAPDSPAAGAPAQRFYDDYKDWVDMQNALVDAHGVFGAEYRAW